MIAIVMLNLFVECWYTVQVSDTTMLITVLLLAKKYYCASRPMLRRSNDWCN